MWIVINKTPLNWILQENENNVKILMEFYEGKITGRQNERRYVFQSNFTGVMINLSVYKSFFNLCYLTISNFHFPLSLNVIPFPFTSLNIVRHFLEYAGWINSGNAIADYYIIQMAFSLLIYGRSPIPLTDL